jgi:hypothetical protein
MLIVCNVLVTRLHSDSKKFVGYLNICRATELTTLAAWASHLA